MCPLGAPTFAEALCAGAEVYAVDVNARGEVVGISYDDAGDVRGFLWRDGEMHDLGGFGAGDTRPAAISASGEVVGTRDNGPRTDRGPRTDHGPRTD